MPQKARRKMHMSLLPVPDKNTIPARASVVPGDAESWKAYLVECADGTYYCGVCKSLERRLAQHNGLLSGGAKYTRARRPVTLLAFRVCPDKSSAYSLEYAVKAAPRGEKMDVLLHNVFSGHQKTGGAVEDAAAMQMRAYNFEHHPLRMEYEACVKELKHEAEALLQAGHSLEDVARAVFHKRRDLGKRYKEAAPALVREYIYFATRNEYGDPLGPSFEQLRRSKSYEEIIASSSRPIKKLSARLSADGFTAWLEERGLADEQGGMCGSEP